MNCRRCVCPTIVLCSPSVRMWSFAIAISRTLVDGSFVHGIRDRRRRRFARAVGVCSLHAVEIFDRAPRSVKGVTGKQKSQCVQLQGKQCSVKFEARRRAKTDSPRSSGRREQLVGKGSLESSRGPDSSKLISYQIAILELRRRTFERVGACQDSFVRSHSPSVPGWRGCLCCWAW